MSVILSYYVFIIMYLLFSHGFSCKLKLQVKVAIVFGILQKLKFCLDIKQTLQHFCTILYNAEIRNALCSFP